MPEIPFLPSAVGSIARRLPAPVLRAVDEVEDTLDRRLGRPRLPALSRRRRIAFFAYTTTGYDGDATSQEDIFTVSPLTGHVERVVDDRANPVYVSDRDPAWSRNRAHLAIHRGSEADPVSRIVIISATSGVTLRTLGTGHSPRWLATSALLYLDSVQTGADDWHEDVFVVDIGTFAVTQVTDLGTGHDVTGMAWHPSAGLALGLRDNATDEHVVAVAAACAVGVARAPGGSPVPRAAFVTVSPAGTQVASPSWSPAADRMAVITWTPGSATRVAQLDVLTGTLTPLALPSDPTLSDAGPVYCADGSTIAFTRGGEDEWSEIWLAPLTGRRRPRQLTDDARGRFKGSLAW